MVPLENSDQPLDLSPRKMLVYLYIKLGTIWVSPEAHAIKDPVFLKVGHSTV